jgi:hypothetical protein
MFFLGLYKGFQALKKPLGLLERTSSFLVSLIHILIPHSKSIGSN